MPLDNLTLTQLKSTALTAMARAHTPLSSFPVGAAVLTVDGQVFPGCNTESIIPGLGTCAERSAVDHAIIHGHRDFVAVMITSQGKHILWPCGACRQYLHEFAQLSGHDPLIYTVAPDGQLAWTRLSLLMPHGFGPHNLLSQ